MFHYSSFCNTLYSISLILSVAVPLTAIRENFTEHKITVDEATGDVIILGDKSKLICITLEGICVLFCPHPFSFCPAFFLSILDLVAQVTSISTLGNIVAVINLSIAVELLGEIVVHKRHAYGFVKSSRYFLNICKISLDQNLGMLAISMKTKPQCKYMPCKYSKSSTLNQ
jgi:hypothetical protein